VNIGCDYQEEAFGQIDCLKRLAYTLCECILPEDKKRHVRAELQAEILQNLTRKINTPESILRQKSCGSVGTASAEACAHRQTLVDLDLHAELRARVLL
jgi:hypothetical protein